MQSTSMRRVLLPLVLILSMILGACAPRQRPARSRATDGTSGPATPRAARPPVRCAIIGGLTMTEVWPKLAQDFERRSGWPVKLVVTGPRPILAEAMRRGEVDFLTMHSGDVTSNLVADGWGADMTVWCKNDLVLMGPPSDPAKVRGLSSGIEAMGRIAASSSPFVDSMSMGPRETMHRLCRELGLRGPRPWTLADGSPTHRDILAFAASHQAYAIVGRMPVLWGKIPRAGMEMMVESDPFMRRPYVAMVANPERLPDVNHAGARALVGYLRSPTCQKLLATAPWNLREGIPLFHPVWPLGAAQAPAESAETRRPGSGRGRGDGSGGGRGRGRQGRDALRVRSDG